MLRRFDETPRPGLLAGLLLAALAIAAYAVPLSHAGILNFDDNLFFGPNNPSFEAAYEGDRMALVDPARPIANAWLPVSHVSLFVDYAMQRALGIGPRLAHAHSLLLHVIAAFVLARLLASLGLGRWPATAAAALFCVHPALTESVAWLSSRKDLLSGLFTFACLGAIVADLRSPSPARIGLAALWAALAMMSKATAVVLVPLAVGVVLLRGREEAVAAGARRWAAVAAAGTVTVLLAVAHTAIAADQGTLQATSGGERATQVPGAFLHYLATLVWPTGLNVLYPEVKTMEAFRAGFGLAGIVVAGVFALGCVLLARGPRLAGAGILAVFAALAPFNTAWPASSIAAADRYLYLAVPWGAMALVALPRGAMIASLAVLPLGWLTLQRAEDFTSSERLWEASLRADEANAVAALNLAIALREDPDRARDLVESAARHARYPQHQLRAAASLRDMAFQRGLTEEACMHAERAAEASLRLPDGPAERDARLQAHLVAANMLRMRGQLDAARAYFERARNMAERHPAVLAYEAQLLLLEAEGENGRVDPETDLARRAAKLLDLALATRPRSFDAELAAAHWARARGELMAALRHFRAARELSPGRPEGYMGAADLYLETGGFEGAEESARAGIAAGVGDPGLLVRLGLAMAGQGNLEEARSYYESYLSVRPTDVAVRRTLGAVIAAQCMNGLFQRTPEQLEVAADRIAELDPENPKGWLIRGLAARMRRDLASALVLLRRAHAALPDHADCARLLAETHRDRGYELLRAGENERALDAFIAFVEIDVPGIDKRSARSILQTHWRRHEAAGTAAFQKGEMKVAEGSFRRCLELVPEQSTACLQLGLAVLAADDGRGEEALALFERAEKGQRALGADASMPVLYQVLTLQRLGKDDEAERRGRRHLREHKVAHPELLARIRAALGGS